MKTVNLFVVWSLTAFVTLFFCGPLQAQKVLAKSRVTLAIAEQNGESSKAINQTSVAFPQATASLGLPLRLRVFAQDLNILSYKPDSRRMSILRI